MKFNQLPKENKDINNKIEKFVEEKVAKSNLELLKEKTKKTVVALGKLEE